MAPIAFFCPDPGAVTVRTDTEIGSLNEFIATLKEEPGSIKNGNDAPGGWSYVVAALVEAAADVRRTKVPYQGYSPTVAAIMSGEVQSARMPVPELIDQHRAGELQILAVTAEDRHFMAPEVPTFRELGIDLVAGDWRVIFAPAGTPDAIMAKLEEIFMATMNDPAFLEAAETAGFVIPPSRPARPPPTSPTSTSSTTTSSIRPASCGPTSADGVRGRTGERRAPWTGAMRRPISSPPSACRCSSGSGALRDGGPSSAIPISGSISGSIRGRT